MNKKTILLTVVGLCAAAIALVGQADMVGRHFMEHPRVRSGLLFPSERFPRLYDAGAIASTLLNLNIGIKAPPGTPVSGMICALFES